MRLHLFHCSGPSNSSWDISLWIQVENRQTENADTAKKNPPAKKCLYSIQSLFYIAGAGKKNIQT